MLRLRIAATITVLVALAIAPAMARATVTTSQITSWESSDASTPANSPYLISLDNPPATTLTVKGTATAATGDRVDVVCFYGTTPDFVKFASGITIASNKTFTTGALPLRPIAGHACRLRAVPAGSEDTSAESAAFQAQQIAVSEAALPVASISSGPNAGLPYNYYVNDVTFSGYAAWTSAGVAPGPGEVGCGGPFAAPIDAAYDVGNFAIDCMGSLLSTDLGVFGGRSEVQVDGHNAYDAASAQSLFPVSGSNPPSQNLTGFPRTLDASITWDPTTGLMSSTSHESWVACNGANHEIQTFGGCPSFTDTGVQLERDITTSDGGRVVTMTDTWSSTDGQPHSVDLLYDDVDGLVANGNGDRGYEFPGQTTFSQYAGGNSVPGPTSAPGSILVRTNVTAPDGDPTEAVGAITFGSAPSGYGFASNNEFEEHNVLVIPAGGSERLTYIYSVGYTVADVTALANAAQDRFQGPSIVIGSPATGTTVSTPTVTLSGITTSGSGIKSLVVGGQDVRVGPDGTWTAQVPLTPGTNTITAIATDGAGATAQVQEAIVYIPPPSPPGSPGPPNNSTTPVVKCKVPKTKGMKLTAAEAALRRAHCKVGKVKRLKSRKVHNGRVISTNPPGGRAMAAGTKIELFVSKGR